MQTKACVLELLQAQRGMHISGEQIAAALSLSRNAVWKAINALRQEGWNITAVTNKGYCLSGGPERLSRGQILQLIGSTAEIYPPEIQIFPSLDSTNQTAKELAVSGASHGTAVLAETQTAGRGRYARGFFSPEGGLYCSVILHPDKLHFKHITAVTAFAAVAACEAVEAVSGKSPLIKWINDIFLGGKKICGILTEAVSDLETGSIGWVVLGIGINVISPAGGFPEELRSTAGAVFEDEALPDAKNRIAAELLRRLLTKTPPEDISLYTAYKSRMLLLGREITVIHGAQEFRAVAEDLDVYGHLLLRMPDGSGQTFSSGEIRIKL